MLVAILAAIISVVFITFSGYALRNKKSPTVGIFAFFTAGITLLFFAGTIIFFLGSVPERGKLLEVSALPDNVALRLRGEFTTYTGMTNFFCA